MKFGIFYEHQLPRPWTDGEEQKLFNDALEQVEVADRVGIDFAWEVEHHFLEEYSHSSAPEVFLAARARSAPGGSRTSRTRRRTRGPSACSPDPSTKARTCSIVRKRSVCSVTIILQVWRTRRFVLT